MHLFEHGVCLGDSLVAGARSRIGLAEALAQELNSRTAKRWLFRSEASNGDTVLQLLRRVDQKPWLWRDATFATVVIGTNDAKSSVATPPELFQMLYGQLLDRLAVAKLLVFPALVPKLHVDGSLASPYDARCNERIDAFNAAIRTESRLRGWEEWLVDTETFAPGALVDGVHFSEEGMQELARRFADRITNR